MFRELIVGFVLLGIVNLSDVSFYEILGVSKASSSLEIRQAYKKLAIKLHPDKNQDESDREKFLKITEAYETLKDPEKRRKYDTYGIHQTYTRQYDFHSQKEYNNMFYNGLYHDDPFVDTVSGKTFYSYLGEGFHFINFYSPFCPPCQSLADQWKKLAEIYKGIVKVAAVNCKYHNSFCYHSMRISSYPSLLFYPEGKNDDFVYYRGSHTLKALEDFVLSHIESKVYVQTLTYIKDVDKPVAYVLGKHRIDRDVLTRIAYRLMGLVTVVIIEDDNIRGRLTNDDYSTVVFKYRKTVKELTTTDEKEILSEIVDVLPEIEPIDPEKFKEIRNQLRNGYKNSWALYFSSSRDHNRLLLHQMRMKFPIMHFGEIDCDKWMHLCLSLQAEDTPTWGLLKPGGGYQKAPPSVDIKSFLHVSPSVTRLHSLMPNTLHTLHEEEDWWVVLVVPPKSSWGPLAEAFTRAALHLRPSDDINFGTVECTEQSARHCREVTTEGPAILIQSGHKREIFNGAADYKQIVEFIQLVKNSGDLELSEQQVLEIVDVSREHAWLVAFLPRGHDRHMHAWRLLADKLRALPAVRVGVLRCGAGGGFCANVRAPTARLYPVAEGQHFSVSLQQVSEAAYLAEWALARLDDCAQLTWSSFSQRVLAEDIQPQSGRKPWLVYFHSPRCHRCYEMYADFSIAGIQLHNAVNLGKVNCLNERGVCQHEHISSYPSLRLYLGSNARQRFSSVVTIPVQHHQNILDLVKAHLTQYDDQLLAGFKAKHDEL